MYSLLHSKFKILERVVSLPRPEANGGCEVEGIGSTVAANSPVFPGFLPFSDPSPAALPFCHFSR